jgi:hypothetical protein
MFLRKCRVAKGAERAVPTRGLSMGRTASGCARRHSPSTRIRVLTPVFEGHAANALSVRHPVEIAVE